MRTVRGTLALTVVVWAWGGPLATGHADCDADALFGSGRRAYEAGEYRRAAELLLAAHDCHPDPALLFNAARAYDRAGERDEAIRTYERYLASSPTSEAAARARAALAALRAAASNATPPDLAADTSTREAIPAASADEGRVAEAPPEPHAGSRSTGSATGPVVVGSVSLAAIVGATALRRVAVRRGQAAERAENHAEGFSQRQEARRLDRAALGLTIVGVGTLLASVAWGWRLRRTRSNAVTVRAGLPFVEVSVVF
jgi:tetratricopeptide (TPR) repeat protein